MAEKPLLSVRAGRDPSRLSKGMLGDTRIPASPEQPQQLRIGAASSGAVAFLVCFGLLWNGGVWSAFVFLIGSENWYFVLFLLPFCLVGIGLIAFTIYLALKLTNPRPVLSVDRSLVHAGESFRLSWQLARPSNRITRMTIKVQGVESATYQQGTNTCTDTEVFYERVIDDRQSAESQFDSWNGTAQVEIPSHLMSSWSSTNNRIVWQIHVKAEIPRWPDIDTSFPFLVAPAKSESIRS